MDNFSITCLLVRSWIKIESWLVKIATEHCQTILLFYFKVVYHKKWTLINISFIFKNKQILSISTKNFWQANSCQSADRTGNTSITTVTLPAAWENATSWRRASASLPPDRRRHTSATRSPGQRPPRPRWPALCSRRSRSLTRPGNASFPFLPSRFYPLAKPPFKQPLKWNCHYSRPFIFLTLIAFIFHYVNYNI